MAASKFDHLIIHQGSPLLPNHISSFCFKRLKPKTPTFLPQQNYINIYQYTTNLFNVNRVKVYQPNSSSLSWKPLEHITASPPLNFVNKYGSQLITYLQYHLRWAWTALWEWPIFCIWKNRCHSLSAVYSHHPRMDIRFVQYGGRCSSSDLKYILSDWKSRQVLSYGKSRLLSCEKYLCYSNCIGKMWFFLMKFHWKIHTRILMININNHDKIDVILPNTNYTIRVKSNVYNKLKSTASMIQIWNH